MFPKEIIKMENQPEFKNWDLLEQQEKNILSQTLLPKGHLDPLLHKNHRETFLVGEDRAFIVGYKHIPYQLLLNSNVRDLEVDEKWCKDELTHQIQVHYKTYPNSLGLQYPVVVRKKLNGEYEIIHGHHRAWTCDQNGTFVPCIIVSDHINSKGGEVDPNALLLAKARCNGKPENLKMTKNDGVLHLNSLIDNDRTLGGRNPTKAMPLQQKDKNAGKFTFEDFCDYAFGNSGNFESPVARGQLFYQWSKKGSVSKTTQAHKPENITLFLAQKGLETGINPTTQSRVDVINHLDYKNKAIIVLADNNGRNFAGKIMAIIKEWYLVPSFKKNLTDTGINKLIVAGRTYKPTNSLTDIQNAREKFFTECQGLSDALSKATDGCLRIHEVHMAKELKIKKDKGETNTMKAPLRVIRRKAI